MDEETDPSFVTVTSNNHHDFLIDGLWNFFITQHGTDFDLPWGTQSTRAHRVLLDVFLTPDKLDRLVQHHERSPSDGDGTHLDVILEFLYTGTVSVSACRLDDVLSIAKELDLLMLVHAVEAAQQNAHGHSGAITREPAKKRRKKKNSVKIARRASHLRTAKSKSLVETDPASEDISDNQADDRATNRNEKTSHMNSPVQNENGAELETQPGAESSDLPHDARIDDEQDAESPIPRKERRRKVTQSRKSPDKAHFKRAPKRCPHCDDVELVTYSQYYAHLRSAHGLNAKGLPIKPSPLQECSECPYTCKTRAEMRYHTADKHGEGADRFHCEQCSFSTGRKSDMVKHVQVTHLNIRVISHSSPYMCETCGHRCVSSTKLKQHNFTHNGVRPYTCKLCQKSFADSSTFRRHRATHEKKRPYVCHVCGRAFGRQDNLNTHLKLGHRTYACTICPFVSNGRGDLSRHIKSDHPSGKPYACDQCEYSSASRLELKRHSRKHSGEKPYVCKLCGAAYGYGTTLRRHIQRHLSDAKPFSCNLCGHSFSVKYSLNAHMKHVHKQVQSLTQEVTLVS